MKNINIAITLFTLISCSHFNQESRDHYLRNRENLKIRHGAIPYSVSEIPIETVLPFELTSVAKGKKLYQKNCLSCHGESGEGNGPQKSEQTKKPANLKKMVRDVHNFEIYFLISQLKGDMPGWQKPLSDKDLKDIRNYILTL